MNGYVADVKFNWMMLPIGLALSCCQPIERGPVGGDDRPKEILQVGHFARTIVDNTAFFRHLPLSGGQADLLLQRHTSVRVIQVDPGYSKVELDSGAVGFVQTAMLEPIARKAAVEVPDGPGVDKVPDATDITPPVGSGIPDILPPTIDPE